MVPGYGPTIKPKMKAIDPISDLDLSDDDGVDSEDIDYQSVEFPVSMQNGDLDLEPGKYDQMADIGTGNLQGILQKLKYPKTYP